MYSIKTHFVKYLLSLFLSDIIIIVLKNLGILNFGLYFIIQIVVTVGFVYYGKIKLYKILEKETVDNTQLFPFLYSNLLLK